MSARVAAIPETNASGDMNIGDLLDRGAISPRVTAAGKRQALAVIAELAARNMGLKCGDVLDALLEREAAGSTGVGYGVAVPHARVAGLTRLRGVFVRLEQPVEFQAVDDRPVDLLFALFAPPEAGAEHLRALARVSRILRQADLREHLRQASGADAIYALLVREARPTAA
jgi:PTS system nitrogen regulatory IIA component